MINHRTAGDGQSIHEQGGLTLIELVMTVVLVSLVLALAVPSFRTMILNNRMASQTNELISALNQARSEAVKRSESVTICRRDRADWLNGWSTLTGDDCTLDAGETEISASMTFEGLSQLVGTANSLTFTGKGLSTAGATVSFTFCDQRGGAHARAVFVNIAGQVTSLTKQPSGVNLVCP